MAYVTSSISKEGQTLPGNFTGRYWGIINRNHLPVAEASEYTLSDRAAVRVNRWFRTLSRKYQEQSRWKTWDALLPKMTNGSKLRPPRRVRQRNNSGGSLLCNASAFWSVVERGIERGIV
jgi:hypothetical protein